MSGLSYKVERLEDYLHAFIPFGRIFGMLILEQNVGGKGYNFCLEDEHF